MFKENEQRYTLEYIQKLFSQIPAIFILLLSILLIFITFFIIDSKEKREIDLLKQKTLLNEKFEQKQYLEKFKVQVDKQLKKSFSDEEIILKKVTYKVSGYLESNSFTKPNFLNDYLKSLEMENDVEIAVFTSDNLNILYGEQSIKYLEKLIYNSDDEVHKNITLSYILSQGKNNTQYWKNDDKKTVRLSFFDKVNIYGKEYCIGSFSTINSIKKITKDSIIDSIIKNDSKIWFYDILTKRLLILMIIKNIINLMNF